MLVQAVPGENVLYLYPSANSESFNDFHQSRLNGLWEKCACYMMTWKLCQFLSCWEVHEDDFCLNEGKDTGNKRMILVTFYSISPCKIVTVKDIKLELTSINCLPHNHVGDWMCVLNGRWMNQLICLIVCIWCAGHRSIIMSRRT